MNIRTLLAGLVVVVLLGFGICFAWFTNQLRAVSNDETAISFLIEEGQGVRTIGKNLKEVSLIRNELVFSTYAKVEGIAKTFQAGTYELRPSFSSQEIARKISEGEVDDVVEEGVIQNNQVRITIREGWSNATIATYLSEVYEVAHDGSIDEAVFLAALDVADSREVVPDSTYAFLAKKPLHATLEGFLYPDTYHIYPEFDVEEIVKKMLDNFEEKIAPYEDAIDASNRSLFEILTVASIIEREVLTDADMKNAADVFWKRLDEGIPLQSDATVNYVTGKNTTRPSFADISIDSPYNTYEYPGLPPGPIGNPSIAAIEAALSPTPNDYYYFLTKEDGTAVFSRTLDEHNANKAKYLK
ncbi:MAG: endolytic transglycosylase MltG [Patescibacteria group bacterium]|jgi:UPF0755 protein